MAKTRIAAQKRSDKAIRLTFARKATNVYCSIKALNCLVFFLWVCMFVYVLFERVVSLFEKSEVNFHSSSVPLHRQA